MGQRMVRVDELVKREVSDVLHTRYQAESVCITVTGVKVSPDLRQARVFYSVFGDDEQADKARRFLSRESGEIRRFVGKRIVLKYLPWLEFVYDDSIERGMRLNTMIDELDLEEEDYL